MQTKLQDQYAHAHARTQTNSIAFTLNHLFCSFSSFSNFSLHIYSVSQRSTRPNLWSLCGCQKKWSSGCPVPFTGTAKNSWAATCVWLKLLADKKKKKNHISHVHVKLQSSDQTIHFNHHKFISKPSCECSSHDRSHHDHISVSDHVFFFLIHC